ncbi:ComEC/Rec2 family competence protein [Martelella radicis]|uniref:ComEC/Rec2-related protein n=1 Tax=Martelella radicis TaxID=1397476 RepID=A0A7W6KG57_9HYPH|nr:ComEC/Rec2 family competence protein [Martelella radicis]MBB4120465.1 ComEC/Rec2-related protein [Martelella radicis]
MGEDQTQSARFGERADGRAIRRKAPGLRRFEAPFRGRFSSFGETDARSRPRWRLAACISDELAFGRAFLFAPLAMASGAAWWFSRPVSPPFWGLLLYWAIAISAWLSQRHARPATRLPAALAAMFLSGAVVASLETLRLSTVMLDSPVTTHVTGVVDAREPTDTGWRYVVRVTATEEPVIHRPPERVTLVARGKLPPVEIGGAVSGLARLSPPSGPALPGLVDFGFLSYFDGIGAVGFFYGAPEAAVVPPPRDGFAQTAGLAASRWVERLRDSIAGRIRAVLPGESGAFANAIITGQRRAMSDATLDALRNAGLAHVIAISGLHMALAAGIFYSALRLLLTLSPKTAEAIATKKLAALTAIGAAGFYLAISGMQVSARRAFIMLAIMLAAAIADRPAISLRNVALAGLAILAVSPSEAVGPGMQMSFATTLALIAGYSLWQKRSAGAGPSVPHGLLRIIMLGVSGIILTALIGGLSTAPIAMAHFQRVAGFGLVGNLLAMPIVTFLVMPAGLVAMLAMPLNLHAPFLLVMGFGLDRVIAIAKWVDGLGGAFETGAMPRGFLLLFMAGFMLLVLLRTRLRLIGLLPMAIALALPALSRSTEGPILLVSEDGALVALVSGQSAALSKSRPPAFTFDQWHSALALKAIAPPLGSTRTTALLERADRFERLDHARIVTATDALAADLAQSRSRPGQFICTKDEWCVATFSGGAIAGSGTLSVAQIFRPALDGPACDHANIVISVYRPGFEACRSGSFLVTPALRRQTGTLRFAFLPSRDGDRVRALVSQQPGVGEIGGEDAQVDVVGHGNAESLKEGVAVARAGEGGLVAENPFYDRGEYDSHFMMARRSAVGPYEGRKSISPEGSDGVPSSMPGDGLQRAAAKKTTKGDSSSALPDGACRTTLLSITPAISSVTRPWNRHRLYDWRSESYDAPLDLPNTLNFVNGSDESGRQACPEP